MFLGITYATQGISTTLGFPCVYWSYCTVHIRVVLNLLLKCCLLLCYFIQTASDLPTCVSSSKLLVTCLLVQSSLCNSCSTALLTFHNSCLVEYLKVGSTFAYGHGRGDDAKTLAELGFQVCANAVLCAFPDYAFRQCTNCSSMLPRSADWWLLERCNHVDDAHAELDHCTGLDVTVGTSKGPGGKWWICVSTRELEPKLSVILEQSKFTKHSERSRCLVWLLVNMVLVSVVPGVFKSEHRAFSIVNCVNGLWLHAEQGWVLTDIALR